MNTKSYLNIGMMIAIVASQLAFNDVGCFVDGKCRTDVDCEWPKICNDEGVCILQCQEDEDCELEQECSDHRCVPAAGCAGCSFDHADPICIHGDCTMGDCHAGWVDANGLEEDGCEYECTPTGEEVCDEIDNDCDRQVDEGFDLENDVENCGECGNICPRPPHAISVCNQGECTYQCEEGWYDNNGPEYDDGCESEVCIPTGDEICDLIDNDCDGQTDEGFDKTLPESCGPLCAVCEYDHAEPLCIDGHCEMGECDEFWLDCFNGWVDGCETNCVPSGEEICDEIDNDCDCSTDEGLNCCPEDMVSIGGLFCVDIYEAHLEVNEYDVTIAVSEYNVIPYWDRYLRWEEADGYCQAAGKRLCSASEIVMACRGPDDTDYCYGDEYDTDICHGIDAPHPDGVFAPAPTGYFEDCTNEYGVFDMCGNVWELATDGLAHAGAYNCIDSASLHGCSFSIDPNRVIAIGFRCCQ